MFQFQLLKFKNIWINNCLEECLIWQPRDLIRRMKKYSDKYYEGNDTLMINALKHVQLYHDWCDITKSYKPIDWKEVKWKMY